MWKTHGQSRISHGDLQSWWIHNSPSRCSCSHSMSFVAKWRTILRMRFVAFQILEIVLTFFSLTLAGTGPAHCSGGAALDVTVVHPLQSALVSSASTVPLHSCIVKEAAKCLKYIPLCELESMDFVPLAFEFFGSWGPAANGFFNKLTTAISRRFSQPRSSVMLSLSRSSELVFCVSMP